MMFRKVVFRLSPDDLGRERVENRTSRSIYTNLHQEGEKPTHTKEKNGLDGTWAVVSRNGTVILSSSTIFDVRED